MKDFLLLTRAFSIREIDFNRDSSIEARPPIVPDQRTFISDSVFDYEQKLVYFYSQRQLMIYSSKMDGESKLEDLFFYDFLIIADFLIEPIPVTTSKIFPIVSAMAYDWYSKLLYMTSIAEGQILVVRMNARDFPQRTLVNGTIGVHGIALDPSQGYVRHIKKTFSTSSFESDYILSYRECKYNLSIVLNLDMCFIQQFNVRPKSIECYLMELIVI